ncbi:MAG: helix-turn-helix domain-containing protein, partial [Cetobacterium sp.]
MKAGEFLKKIRLEKKLSLRQMSYKTNLSHTFISEIEKGKLNGALS